MDDPHRSAQDIVEYMFAVNVYTRYQTLDWMVV